ncbi:hypothetical protein ACAG25_12815 [Mycobacterium sp. pV006]|uniref:hypothetical protein n=1 Tax=Mycobacterium sp. pV006 TaxID=3238983 RepID=UPI00351AF079
MTWGQPWPAPPPGPRRSKADLVLSIAVLVVTVLIGLMGALIGFFLLVFLDHCPPETCSVDAAVNAVFTAVLVAGAIGLTGGVLSVIQLVRAKPAWPFATGTLALCVLTLFLGGIAYTAAVGG